MEYWNLPSARKPARPSRVRARGGFADEEPESSLPDLRPVKERLLAEYAPRFAGARHALRLALNEAEALSAQTPFPHLVFPLLAREKAEALAAWRRRQGALRRRPRAMAFAA